MADPLMAGALPETALEPGMNLLDNADGYGLDWGGGGTHPAEVAGADGYRRLAAAGADLP